jgi:Mlc titration factor MtfA (ptsG expression regulator)/Tfp pilus assembly protein PilF
VLFSWLKKRRRRQLLAEPCPAHLEELVEQNVQHFRFLPRELRRKLLNSARVFQSEAHWFGGGDLTINAEIRITIAAQACVLLLGVEADYFFDGVQTVIVREDLFSHIPTITGPAVPGALQVVNEHPTMLGQAWQRGPILLSWPHVLVGTRDAQDGENVVLHEFAHHLDGLSGAMGGTPMLTTRALRQNWQQITEAEFLSLVGSAQRGEATLLDHYGATNRAEFFAVATECFFERPHAIKRQHAALYQILCDYYRQDPTQWIPHDAMHVPRAWTDHDPDEDDGGDESRHRQPPLESADDYFTRGVANLSDGYHQWAADDFAEAGRRDPDDGEAHQHRAEALLYLGRANEALAACQEAVRCDPRNVQIRRIRGAAFLELSQFESAIEDLNIALNHDEYDAEAFYLRGRAHAALNQYRRAIADFSQTILLQPLNAEAHYRRALAYQARGRPHKAESDLQRARLLNPDIS